MRRFVVSYIKRGYLFRESVLAPTRLGAIRRVGADRVIDIQELPLFVKEKR